MSNPASTSFSPSNSALQSSMPRASHIPTGPFRDSQPDFGSDDGNGNDSPSPILVTTAMASPEATAPAVPTTSSSRPTVPTLSPDISTLISWITKIKMPMSGAPMPSTADAPKLKGRRNFRTFLEDFEMLADNAGWTPQQKCQHVHKYCNSKTRALVRTLKSRKRNDWDATVAEMRKMYRGDERQDKYSRDSLERFVARDRVITKKAHFIDYHQKFCTTMYQKPIKTIYFGKVFQRIYDATSFRSCVQTISEAGAKHLLSPKYTTQLQREFWIKIRFLPI